MKTLFSILCLISIAAVCCRAGSADEKAFTDKYKTAFESKDTKTLESFLYTTGSDPGALEFYKMMMSGEAGSKISSIELVALTPDEMKKAMDMVRNELIPQRRDEYFNAYIQEVKKKMEASKQIKVNDSIVSQITQQVS